MLLLLIQDFLLLIYYCWWWVAIMADLLLLIESCLFMLRKCLKDACRRSAFWICFWCEFKSMIQSYKNQFLFFLARNTFSQASDLRVPHTKFAFASKSLRVSAYENVDGSPLKKINDFHMPLIAGMEFGLLQKYVLAAWKMIFIAVCSSSPSRCHLLSYS